MTRIPLGKISSSIHFIPLGNNPIGIFTYTPNPTPICSNSNSEC